MRGHLRGGLRGLREPGTHPGQRVRPGHGRRERHPFTRHGPVGARSGKQGSAKQGSGEQGSGEQGSGKQGSGRHGAVAGAVARTPDTGGGRQAL